MKQVLTIEQMQHLQELGCSTRNASMCLIRDTEGNRHLSVHDEYCYGAAYMNPIPSYTLADIIEMLPKQIEDRDGYQSYIVIYHDGKMWVVSYSSEDEEYSEMGYQYHYESGIELIDAAYEMLCWCLKNKYIETKEK